MNNILKNKIVTVIGGSGFIGRYVVKLLAEAGCRVRVIVRNKDNALYLKTSGEVGQITILSGDISKPESIKGKLDNSFAVINLVGILFEGGGQKFDSVQAKGAGELARLAKESGAEHFIHISALGVDKAKKSKYAATKLAGEEAVLREFPAAVILRPSIVFGAEDGFFNKFASLSCIAPFLPLIGGGKTRFQPVYVMDLAKAIIAVTQENKYQGQIFELGGSDVYSFKELLIFISQVINRKICLLNIPFGIARLVGQVAQFLPKPPITKDQVILLEYDNVVSDNAKTFADIGIKPESVNSIVPSYLARFVRRIA